MLASHFSRFFAANPGFLHFCAHSHHPWPDATEAAQARYWQDSACLADRKWDRVMGEVVPKAQAHVARLLCLPDPRQVAFAPNTHEFVTRLYSCLEADRPLRVLTTSHEFHSFRRQTKRMAEAGQVVVEEIPGAPWATFGERFIRAEGSGDWDLVWISHVFFDSGFVVEALEAIVAAAPPRAMVVVDGYHAFCAVPADLSRVHPRAFYLTGGYKYAMAGEGACALIVPPGCKLRPVDTGWFASFSDRSGAQGAQVPYADDAFRFWGATFDASGLYRFNAAMDFLLATGTTIADVHRHAHRLQGRFLEGVHRARLKELSVEHLVPPQGTPRGNFLTFDVDDAESRYDRLTRAGIGFDRRDRKLRFGFGVYQDDAMVDRLVETIARTLE